LDEGAAAREEYLKALDTLFDPNSGEAKMGEGELVEELVRNLNMFFLL